LAAQKHKKQRTSTMTTELATTASSPALLLQEDATDSVSQVVVHPLVLLGILDHHTRRQEADGRVIGTLLGRRDGNKVCFVVILTPPEITHSV
jgi:hypothetical protein